MDPTTTAASTPQIQRNPWLMGLWLTTILAGAAGIQFTATNTDPTAYGYDPTAAAIGPPLIVAAGFLLAGALTATAILWQLRQHR